MNLKKNETHEQIKKLKLTYRNREEDGCQREGMGNGRKKVKRNENK